MKYDITKKATRGAERTLEAFSGTMFGLLSTKPLEEITVNELCEKSNYPRATFYNYFDDKYDLLNYCWYSIYEQIHLNEYKSLDPEESLYIFFDRAYDFITIHQNMIKNILKFNSGESFLSNHFRIQLSIKMREVFYLYLDKDRYKIPYEIIADHYCNTILLTLEWHFLKENDCSKVQAHEYLKFLLGAL